MSSIIQLPGEIRLQALPPLALYIHMPWCVRKCPYCDFNSHAVRDGFPENTYIDALIRDLELSLPLIWGRPIHTIFFGGGTPSLFSPEAIDRLLMEIRARVKVLPGAEITLEANPGTVEAGKLQGFKHAGVNRVSLGIQSFNAQHLSKLGRIHDRNEAERAVQIARDTFDTFNIDLMYALPDQTMAELRDDLSTALAFEPPHLSYYHLTLEPNTLFHRYPPNLPDDDLAADMQELIENQLGQAGYGHYETSAYAKPGHQCRHNLNYWLFGDYLGIGAGAHSKLSFPDRITRMMKYKHPQEYLQKITTDHVTQEQHNVPGKELPFEFMMNALRLSQGFDVALYNERTGLPRFSAEKSIKAALNQELLEYPDPQLLRPTLKGQRFLNDLLQLFLDQ